MPFGGGATAPFSAYTTGSGVALGAVDTGETGPRVADAEVAFSSAAFNSQGLGAITNEMKTAVVPAAGSANPPVDSAGAESYAKGSGVEVGLGQELPVTANQIPLTQASAASAPPVRSDGEPGVNPASTGLVKTSLVDVPLGPVAFASAARGKAGAVWSPSTCIAGQPISYGEGSVAQLDVLDVGTTNEDGTLQAPIITLEQSQTDQQAVESRSMTYLFPNTGPDGTADGTFGVGTITEMILAPISLAQDATTGLPALEIDVAGTWYMSVRASGKAPAEVQYGLLDPPADPDVPIISIFQGDELLGGLTFEDILGGEGLTLPPDIAALLSLGVGEDPRDIAAPNTDPDPDSQPVKTITQGRAAADVLRLNLLTPSAPGDTSVRVAGLRVGHFETDVRVPEGGIRCQFPVSKVGPDSVTTGQEFTWTITIPSDPNALAGVACKLTDIAATDLILTKTGNPKVRITSVSNGGTISADKQGASWSGLGSYDPNDPNRQPIVMTVKAVAEGAGTFQNTVDVTAKLTDCTGGGLFDGSAQLLAEFLGRANIQGDNAIQGGTEILGVGQTAAPTAAVLAERVLPTTGASRGLTMLGIMAMLSAAGVYLFNRKVSSHTT